MRGSALIVFKLFRKCFFFTADPFLGRILCVGFWASHLMAGLWVQAQPAKPQLPTSPILCFSLISSNYEGLAINIGNIDELSLEQLDEALRSVFQKKSKSSRTQAVFRDGLLIEHYSGLRHPILHPNYHELRLWLQAMGAKIQKNSIVIDLDEFLRAFSWQVKHLVETEKLPASDAFDLAQISFDGSNYRFTPLRPLGKDPTTGDHLFDRTHESLRNPVISAKEFNRGLAQRLLGIATEARLVTGNIRNPGEDLFGLHSILFHDLMHAVGLLIEPRFQGVMLRSAQWLETLSEPERTEGENRFLQINEKLVMIDPEAFFKVSQRLKQFGCVWSSRSGLKCTAPHKVEHLARLALHLFFDTAPFVRRIGGGALSPLFSMQPALNRYDEATATLSPEGTDQGWLKEGYSDLAFEGLNQFVKAIYSGSQIRLEDIERYIRFGEDSENEALVFFLKLN